MLRVGLGRDQRSATAKVELARALDRSTAEACTEALHLLMEHRLQFVASQAIEGVGLSHKLPSPLGQDLHTAHLLLCQREGLMQAALAHVGHAFAERDLWLIACKGIVLSSDYYPARGLRPMQDIDLWVDGERLELAKEALNQAGFREQPEKQTDHAFYFENAWGLSLDVHHRMALFQSQGLKLLELSRPHPHLGCRVFIPEALLVHLVVHLLGHTNRVGVLLGWIADVALVVDAHPNMDWGKVRMLCPDKKVWNIVLRLIAFAHGENWCALPQELQTEVSAIRPISFAALTRIRRLAPWDLAHARGWVRLARHMMWSSERDVDPVPAPIELILGLRELVAESTGVVDAESALLTSAHHH